MDLHQRCKDAQINVSEKDVQSPKIWMTYNIYWLKVIKPVLLIIVWQQVNWLSYLSNINLKYNFLCFLEVSGRTLAIFTHFEILKSCFLTFFLKNSIFFIFKYYLSLANHLKSCSFHELFWSIRLPVKIGRSFSVKSSDIS